MLHGGYSLFKKALSVLMNSRAKLSPQLTSRVYPLRIPLPPDKEKGWKPYPIFRGFTGGLQNLSCHVSVLKRDCLPHSPHSHKEEELLMLLSGEIELILPEAPNGNQQRHLKPGQFVYYPSHFTHTLQTTSDAPANYLMFKWQDDSKKNDSELAFGQFNTSDHMKDSENKIGFNPRLVFEGSTTYLRKLHCHTSTVSPGAGYDPHIDAYDVAIIILEGEVETLGESVGPHSVIFYAAGEPHGMRNPSGAKAKYLVFEFHWRNIMTILNLRYLSSSLFSILTNPRGWKRRLKHIFKLFSG
jgi:uncharacterized cupin superfamily protein